MQIFCSASFLLHFWSLLYCPQKQQVLLFPRIKQRKSISSCDCTHPIKLWKTVNKRKIINCKTLGNLFIFSEPASTFLIYESVTKMNICVHYNFCFFDSLIVLSFFLESLFRLVSFDILLLISGDFFAFWYDSIYTQPLNFFYTMIQLFLQGNKPIFHGEDIFKQQNL